MNVRQICDGKISQIKHQTCNLDACEMFVKDKVIKDEKFCFRITNWLVKYYKKLHLPKIWSRTLVTVLYTGNVLYDNACSDNSHVSQFSYTQENMMEKILIM